MSDARRRWLTKLADGLKNAFALAGPHGPLTDADRALLMRLAAFIVARRMAGPALLFLQSIRPLSYLGGQALTFLRPFLTPLFNRADYERLAAVLERREGVGALCAAIEAALGGTQDGGRRNASTE